LIKKKQKKEVFTAEDKNVLNTVKKYGLSSFELDRVLKEPPKDSKTNKKLYDHAVMGRVKIGIFSDSHIGVKEFDENLFIRAAQTFKKEKVIAAYHPGDILEGMSGREGHIYELAYTGFSQQITYAVKLFKKHFRGLKVYGIIGNHDLWYKKKMNQGIDVGQELEARLGKDNFEYLGENDANIKLGPRTIMKLFHPNDGTAYATSYKMQKLVESLESGKKPQIIVEGHYHKALYMFCRNVHCIEAGTLCGQTEFMRGKKIPAHKGFWILDMDIAKTGITRFTPSFYPSYD